MSDVISRQAAIDEAYEITVDGQKFEVVQVETLMGLPSAQPEIIRCKDCKYYIDNRCYKIKALDDLRGSNDFCSYAERRADEWLVNV